MGNCTVANVGSPIFGKPILNRKKILYNQADEPDGGIDAVYRKCRASLKGYWPAGYPQTFVALAENLLDKLEINTYNCTHENYRRHQYVHCGCPK